MALSQHELAHLAGIAQPAQPPATVPRHRKEAWLKGWMDQQAFMERQAAAKAQNRGKRRKAGAK